MLSQPSTRNRGPRTGDKCARFPIVFAWPNLVSFVKSTGVDQNVDFQVVSNQFIAKAIVADTARAGGAPSRIATVVLKSAGYVRLMAVWILVLSLVVHGGYDLNVCAVIMVGVFDAIGLNALAPVEVMAGVEST